MKVHHLNFGTLRPRGRRRINGDGSRFQAGRLVCHCLVVEAHHGLVLVDTGFGLDDIAERRRSLLLSALPPARVHPGAAERGMLHRTRQAYVRLAVRAKLDPEETAIRQVARLGYAVEDVSDVVLTHLDLDHAGGLRDFPAARVHLLQAELDAATSPATRAERFRYWAHHWSHGPNWVTYGPGGGETWFGFEGVHRVDGVPELLLVPLPGHTRGHAGVALQTDGGRWLLHAGDSYFFHGEVEREPHSTPGLAAFQKSFQVQGSIRRRTRDQVRELAITHGDQVQVFCSHDPHELERHGQAAAR